ncbi:hypothetical protein [Protaetiibacter mangrovi]|uniref:Uncharacterized protein n=1 Tax=Protaetiibacter mangrovi TaxID=2970926 RepID=A0ABT1ZIP6_9MICO|nr:hypothetical protein [Protaetiibacter mangrovi]MCS0500455.1 hypothetical protein [Protaetiibacter mangrovi]TPX04887.1 hypothetical protein FJ656_09460 [Schumannella luteola]
MQNKNLDAAIKAVSAEQGAEVASEDVTDYLARVDELIAAAQALKAPHRKAIAAEASRKSRAKKAAEVEAMRARLAELEASAAK